MLVTLISAGTDTAPSVQGAHCSRIAPLTSPKLHVATCIEVKCMCMCIRINHESLVTAMHGARNEHAAQQVACKGGHAAGGLATRLEVLSKEGATAATSSPPELQLYICKCQREARIMRILRKVVLSSQHTAIEFSLLFHNKGTRKMLQPTCAHSQPPS